MKIFLDLGYHKGQGLKEFTKTLGIDSSWQVHCWEPNPATVIKRSPVGWNINHHNSAIWVQDGELPFNQEANNGAMDGWGSSLIPGYGWNDTGHRAPGAPILAPISILVPCIDFVEWILDNTQPNDEIYIKMDIEGAEFPVLRRMLDHEDVFDRIKFMAVEFHARFVIGETADSEEELISQLTEILPEKTATTGFHRHW